MNETLCKPILLLYNYDISSANEFRVIDGGVYCIVRHAMVCIFMMNS